MFSGLFGTREYKVNHLNAAMSLYEQVYLNDIRAGFSVEVANASATAASENYMSI